MDQMNSAPNQNTKSATIPSDGYTYKTSQIKIKNTDQTEKNIFNLFWQIHNTFVFVCDIIIF